MTAKPVRVLVVAGSDPSGGAGIQADIKTAAAFGAYAMTAVTAITIQDTERVSAVHLLGSAVVRDQILACLGDIGVDVIKTGVLGDAETIRVVAQALAQHAQRVPLVVDPVLASTGGTPFADAHAIEALKAELLPLATLATPNIDEYRRLYGNPWAAPQLPALPCSMLMTGERSGSEIVDTLVTREVPQHIRFASTFLESRHTHGTGCTLATAIACGLGEGLGLEPAILRARSYVYEGIQTAPGFGRGRGPLNHLRRDTGR